MTNIVAASLPSLGSFLKMQHAVSPAQQGERKPALDLAQARTELDHKTVANTLLFLKRWAANPLQMGSIVPSSAALCERVVRQTRWAASEYVLELGAGTGVISRALLAAGFPAERLIVCEIVPSMAEHLQQSLRGVHVIQGDARDLPTVLPASIQGNIGTVICGIPLVLLPLAEQAKFIDSMEAVAPGRGFLHYSYCATSPLPWKKHSLTAKREEWTPLNFPPASVWRYTPNYVGTK